MNHGWHKETESSARRADPLEGRLATWLAGDAATIHGSAAHDRLLVSEASAAAQLPGWVARWGGHQPAGAPSGGHPGRLMMRLPVIVVTGVVVGAAAGAVAVLPQLSARDAALVAAPSVSPEAATGLVVLDRAAPGAPKRLRLLAPGSEPVTLDLGATPVGCPTVSPDGEYLSWSATDPDSGLTRHWLSDLDGRDVRSIPMSGGEGFWARDSANVLIPLTEGNPVRETQGLTPSFRSVTSPEAIVGPYAVSPDGGAVAGILWRPVGGSRGQRSYPDLAVRDLVVDPVSGSAQLVPEPSPTAATRTYPLAPGGYGAMEVLAPIAWSSDGTRIAVATRTSTRDPEVHIIRLDDGTIQRTTVGLDVADIRWTVDGRLVVATQGNDATITFIDGATVGTPTHLGPLRQVALSPDGTLVGGVREAADGIHVVMARARDGEVILTWEMGQPTLCPVGWADVPADP